MTLIARIALWFATSKLGQYIAAGFAIAVAIGVAVLKVFSAGKASERAREDRASLDHLRSRVKTNDEISALPPSAVDQRLDRWVRREDEG